MSHFMTCKMLADDARGPLTAPTLARQLILMRETYVFTCSMMRLSGHHASLLLLRIMGRISHFTLRSLPMKIPLSALLMETTPLLSIHKILWDVPSLWILRKTVKGFVPALLSAFPNVSPALSALPSVSPTLSAQAITSSFALPSVRTSTRRSSSSNELKESSGSTDHPITAVPDRAGLFGDATVEDDDKDISRLFPDLAEFVLDLQSSLERSIAEVLANDEFIALPDSASPFCSSLAPSSDLSELAPSSDLPSLSVQGRCQVQQQGTS